MSEYGMHPESKSNANVLTVFLSIYLPILPITLWIKPNLEIQLPIPSQLILFPLTFLILSQKCLPSIINHSLRINNLLRLDLEHPQNIIPAHHVKIPYFDTQRPPILDIVLCDYAVMGFVPDWVSVFWNHTSSGKEFCAVTEGECCVWIGCAAPIGCAKVFGTSECDFDDADGASVSYSGVAH